MMTADEAIDYLSENRGGHDASLKTILSAQNRMRMSQPGSAQYQQAQRVLDAEVAKADAAKERQAFQNIGVDPAFGMAACDCKPNEPCCMTKGEVADAADGSRKVAWPTAKPPLVVERNLLVIAKEMQGRNLTAKVKTSWSGRNCPLGKSNSPHIRARNLRSGPEVISANSQEVTVGMPAAPSSAITAIGRIVSPKVIAALTAIDMLLAMRNAANASNQASFAPSQCFTDASTGATLTVTPVPCLKIDGDATASTMLRFSTAGVNGSAGVAGNLTGKVGNTELSLSAEASAISGAALARSDSSKAPGMIGMLAGVIATMNEYVKKGNTVGTVRDVSNYASSVTLSKSLGIKVTGAELKEKGGSPDLELKLGSILLELKIGITGRLDIIDALATYFSGPGASAIRKARAEMAAGKMIKGKLDAYVEVGAEGTLTHSIRNANTITIPANLPGAESTSLPEVFRGEIKIRGILSIGIEIEAEVWVFAGKAGANGTVNTSWTWALRKQGEERQKSYTFEGLVVELKTHAEVGVRSGSDDSGGSAIGGGASPRTTSSSSRAVAEHLEKSKAEAERIGRSGIAGVSRGRTYTLLPKEESGWQKY